MPTYIVTSPLWLEPIEVTVHSGPFETAFALQAATGATVWDKADYEQAIGRMSSDGLRSSDGLSVVPDTLLEIWRHPVSAEVAMNNQRRRNNGETN